MAEDAIANNSMQVAQFGNRLFCAMARRTEPQFPEHDEGRIAGLDLAFGIVLRKLRDKSEMSQQTVADHSGVGRAFVSLLERGQRGASVSTVFQLSRTLGIAPEEFVRMVHDELRKQTVTRRRSDSRKK